MTQLEKLTGMKENLEKAYDSLYEQVEKNSPTLEDDAMREMTTMMWSEAIEGVQKEHQRLCDFSKKLPPGLRNEFEGLIDGSFIDRNRYFHGIDRWCYKVCTGSWWRR